MARSVFFSEGSVHSGWKRRTARLAGMVLGMVLTAGVASADILTYTPPDHDVFDLDHYYAYTWRIDGINLAGQEVTGATLRFKKMFNWDDDSNELFIHLLDTAKNSGIRSFQDEYNDPDDPGEMVDDFVNTRHHNNPNWLVNAGTEDTFLTSRSFAMAGKAVNDSSSGESNAASLEGWSWAADGQVYYAGAYRNVYTYTYTFSEGEEDKLQQYITSGGNIALGLDADCHFYNDGVRLQITTGPASVPAVPEPGTLALLGTGLAYGYRRYRRGKQPA